MHAGPPRADRPVMLAPRNVIATIALLLVVALCVRLGVWQLDRRAERRSYNAALGARALEAPVVDPVRLQDTTGLIYRMAELHGHYDHDRAIALPGRSHAGAPGVHLLTPLRLDGSNAAILVNRGWVPAADGATIDFPYFTTDTSRSLHGMLLPFPGRADSRGAATPTRTDDTFRRVWYGVDPDAMRRQFPYPLVDAQLQLVGDGSRTEAPLPLAPPVLDDGPHLGYAIQWFSFALIGIIGWGVLVLRNRTGVQPRAAPPPRE